MLRGNLGWNPWYIMKPNMNWIILDVMMLIDIIHICVRINIKWKIILRSMLVILIIYLPADDIETCENNFVHLYCAGVFGIGLIWLQPVWELNIILWPITRIMRILLIIQSLDLFIWARIGSFQNNMLHSFHRSAAYLVHIG